MAVPPEFDARRHGRESCFTSTFPRPARTGGVVRPEEGPITLDELVEFLGRTGCQVRIQPVLDPTEVAPVDGYEVPQRLRAAVRADRSPMFPFGTCVSPTMDLDHTER